MTSLIQVKKLSHVGLNVRDVESQVNFYSQMVGLGESGRDEAGRVYLRCNSNHHALVLIPSAESGIDHFALDVGGKAELDAAARALDQAGISYESNLSDELGQGNALRLRDPSGFVVELVAGMEQVDPNYGVRAVQPRKFQHLTLRTPHLEANLEFYTQVLGFRISDWVGENMVWLRCNPDHHGIACSRYPRPMMHHLAFEVVGIGQLVHQAEHLCRHDHTLLYGPGRHGPGANLFIYFHDTEQNIIEFSADMQQIWDDHHHQPKVWDPNQRWSNMWGPHSRPEFRR
ncbi:MAG: VOC family protein [Ardenticatenaceae bacterium]